jgi:hypothetical protein
MKLLSLITLAVSATACAHHVQRFCTDRRERDTFAGRIHSADVFEYKYIPFEVSPGVTSIRVGIRLHEPDGEQRVRWCL